MKKIILASLLFAICFYGYAQGPRPVYYSGGNFVTVTNTGASTNTVFSTSGTNAFVITNESRVLPWQSATVQIRDAIETNEPVNLHQLNVALGGISVLYASTNKNLNVESFYDARTFLPAHTQSIIKVTGITNGQYLAGWISNTGLITQIRQGIAVISSQMRLTTTVGGRYAWVKPELYKWIGTNDYPELFEVAQSNNLTSTFTDYMNQIDCSSNVVLDATNRVLVRWKCINQGNNPDWEFLCGTGLVIAARLPTAQPIDVQAKVIAGTGISSIVSSSTGSVINTTIASILAGTNTYTTTNGATVTIGNLRTADSNLYYTFTSAQSMATIQSVIDTLPLDGNGYGLYITFTNGVYTNTSTFRLLPHGMHGYSNVVISGSVVSNDVHTNQSTIFFMTNTTTFRAFISYKTALTRLVIQNICFNSPYTTTEGTSGQLYIHTQAGFTYIPYCSFLNSNNAVNHGIDIVGGANTIDKCAFSSQALAISLYNSVFLCTGNKTVGGMSSIGYGLTTGLLNRGDTNVLGTTDNFILGGSGGIIVTNTAGKIL